MNLSDYGTGYGAPAIGVGSGQAQNPNQVQAPIHNELDSLEKTHEVFSTMLVDLASRLSPVITPDMPKPSGAGQAGIEKEGPLCPLASRIRDTRRRLERQIDGINELKARLEI